MDVEELLGSWLRSIGYYAAISSPLIPVHLHLLASALFPIVTGAHASLVCPSSAAKPLKTSEEEENLDEVEESKLEILSASDALLLPLASGTVLAGLYYLIQYLEDPELLNRLLNYYFSAVGIFAVTGLLGDSLTFLTSFLFPQSYSLGGRTFAVNQVEKSVCSRPRGETTSLLPLPGLFSKIPLPNRVRGMIWTTRGLLHTKLNTSVYVSGLVEGQVPINVNKIIGFGLALVSELYFNFVAKPWWLTNLLGFSFSYTALQYMSPSTALVGSLILSSLFFYDIFFVFYTPMMVTVATKLDIPAKLMFPRPSPSSSPEDAGAMSMLGLGDVVLPGMMIAFALRFDLYLHYLKQGSLKSRERQQQTVQSSEPETASASSKPRYIRATGNWGERFWTRKSGATEKIGGRFKKTYFVATIVGYVLGMVTTIICMHIASHAQPALLYLVPGVLGSLFITALWNGEFKTLWSYDEAAEEDDPKTRAVTQKVTGKKSAAGSKTPSSMFTKLWAEIRGAQTSEEHSKTADGTVAKGSASGENVDAISTKDSSKKEATRTIKPWVGKIVYFSIEKLQITKTLDISHVNAKSE